MLNLRVLIDESLPVELADELPLAGVSTVRAEQWLGLRNGVLLRAAVDRGFTLLITSDANLRYQQNLQKIGVAVIVIVGIRTRIEELRPLIGRIAAVASRLTPGEVIEISGAA